LIEIYKKPKEGVQVEQSKTIKCPNLKNGSFCGEELTVYFTDQDVLKGCKNIVCPYCNGSISFQITEYQGDTRISGPLVCGAIG